jgi:hypothetical protein
MRRWQATIGNRDRGREISSFSSRNAAMSFERPTRSVAATPHKAQGRLYGSERTNGAHQRVLSPRASVLKRFLKSQISATNRAAAR